MLVRWDGRKVVGVAHLSVLGTLDLIDLLAGDDGSAGIKNFSRDPEAAAAELLTVEPTAELDISLKGIFYTARPRTDRRTIERPRRTHWDEPMPFLF